MPLPDYFISELKARSDIRDIVSSYVSLKRSGKNLLGLCPFHNEKTPSFNVNVDNGFFHCFGCGAGGDVVTFIMRIENLDYMEAIRFLADRAGLTIPQEGYDDSMTKLRTRVLEINRETARFYHKNLMSPEGRGALEYFLNRRLSVKTIKHFGLGYAPEGWDVLVKHLKSLGYTEEEMYSADVAMKTRRGTAIDRFMGRAMFPIIDLRGNVVAFGGRRMSDENKETAKYINSKDTPVYHKGSGLFAMNFAKNSGKDSFILAEGYMDVIVLHVAGFTSAIASLGTALTSEQAKLISRYAKEIIVCYDSDSAGQKATQRAIPILRNAGLLVKVITVPGGKDPDDFFKTNGPEGPAKFKALIEASGNDIEYRLEKLKHDFNLTENDGKIRFMTEACNILGGLDNEIERDVYIGKLSDELKIDKNAILSQVKKRFRTTAKQKEKKEMSEQIKHLSAVNNQVNPEKSKNLRVTNAEEGIITYLFNNPDGIDYVKTKLPTEKFCTNFCKRVYSFILGKNIYGNPLTLMDFSGEFTQSEMSEIAAILARRDIAKVSREDADEYINIILNETTFSSVDKIKDADENDILEFLRILGKNKK